MAYALTLGGVTFLLAVIWGSPLVEIMRQDKKAQGGKLTFILARGIGEAFIARDVADANVIDFLKGDLQRR